MPEVVIRNNNVTVYVTQPSTTETVYVLQGPAGPRGLPGADGADGVNGTNGADGVVQSIVAGANVTVDSTDPANPVVSATDTTDHGALSGLGDDDHPQYHNDARGDARYYTKAQADARDGLPTSTQGLVNTAETTTSTSFTDLATVGPDTTIVAPASGAIGVLYGARLRNTGAAGQWASASPEVRDSGGAVVAAPSPNFAIQNFAANERVLLTGFRRFSGLTPGATYTVRLKYLASADTAEFALRSVIAFAFQN